MAGWLLLKIGQEERGEAVAIEQPEMLRAEPASDVDGLSVAEALFNGDSSGDAAQSLARGGEVALRLLERLYRKLWSAAPLRRLSVRTLAPLSGSCDGDSADLLYALVTFLKLAKDDGLIKSLPARDFAATGTLRTDADGAVGPVQSVALKVEAAIQTLPPGSIVFYPRKKPHGEHRWVDEPMTGLARERGIALESVAFIEEALAALGVDVALLIRARRKKRILRILAPVAVIAVIGILGLKWLDYDRNARKAHLLSSAQKNVQNGEPFTAVREILESMDIGGQAEPDPASEAVLLQGMLLNRVVRHLPPQPLPIDKVGQVSSDGKRLLTASETVVRVLDLDAPDQAHPRLLAHSAPLEFGEFAGPRGQIVTATQDRIFVWSGQESKPREFPKDREERILATNPNTETILVAGASARLLDIETGQERPLSGNARLVSAAFGPHGKSLLTVDERGIAGVWQLTAHGPDRQSPVGERAAFGRKAAFSPDGKWFAAAFSDRTVLLCADAARRSDCRHLKVEVSGNENIHSHVELAFDQNGQYLAASVFQPNLGGALAIWVLKDSSPPRELARFGLQDESTQLIFSATGEKLFAASRTGAVKVYDLSLSEIAMERAVPADPEFPLLRAFAGPGRRQLSLLSRKGEIRVWDLESTYPRRLLLDPVSPYPVQVFAFAPDGQSLYAAVQTGTDTVDLQRWKIVRQGVVPEDAVGLSPLALQRRNDTSEAARAVANAALEGSQAACDRTPLQVVNARRDVPWGRVEALLRAGDVQCIAVRDDGQALATVDRTNGIHLWDLSSNPVKHLQLAGHELQVVDMAFSHDGRRLVSASADKTARIWILGSDRVPAVVLDGHKEGLKAARFDASGTLLGTLSWDGNLRLWDVPTGKQLVELARQVLKH